MDSVTSDMIQRAVTHLHTVCSNHEAEKEAKRLHDIDAEIIKREFEVQQLEGELDDLHQSAYLLDGKYPALALAMRVRADILLDEINKAKPHALIKKRNDHIARTSKVQSIAHVLDELGQEPLDV